MFQNEKMREDFFHLTLDALKTIETHLTEEISVEEVTGKLEQSHWYFQRMFRSVVGVPMGQYLRERRLSAAAEALRTSKHRVLDVAVEYDFGSQEAFTRSFKSFFGINPTECRSNPELVLRESRNPITADKLRFFWNNVQRTPQVIEREEVLLLGSKVEYASHFVQGRDCLTKVVGHWAEFVKCKDLIPHRTTIRSTGVVISSELDMRENKLTYFAGVEVSHVDSEPTEALQHLEPMKIPGGLYACFENRGIAQTHSKLMDYIYGIWLPCSDYKRRNGFDLELFDYRYKQGDPNSLSCFLVPIEAR